MASFLESLFGSFTGQPAIDAANAARGTLTGVYGTLTQNNRNQLSNSLTDTTTMYGLGRDTASPYFNQAGQYISGAGGQAIDTLQGMYGQPLAQTGGMYGNALGLNGPGGTAAAQGAFQTGPGYQFALEQGLDAIARNANSVGMGASGNMLREAQTYGQGLANQEYNNWLKNLQGRESLYAPLGRSITDVMTEQGRNLASLDTAQAQFYNQSFIDEVNRRNNLGLGYAGLDVSAAGIFGPALASTDLAVGAAQQQAGANTVNAIGNTLTGIGNIFSPGR